MLLNTWLAFRKDLKRFITNKVKQREDAEDLLQEVFIKFQTSLPTLKQQEKIIPWLYQITRNLITDYYRKQPRLIGVDAIEELAGESDNLPQSLCNCLKPFMELLPASDQEALLLVEIEGLSQRALAEKLGISYSGARSRTQRAREKLKDLLLECCYFETDTYGNVLEVIPKKSCPSC
jgi:RNA polymerase sigma-70 factor, ECF subfamily